MLSNALGSQPCSNRSHFIVGFGICPPLVLINKMVLVAMGGSEQPDIPQACGRMFERFDRPAERVNGIDFEHLSWLRQFSPRSIQFFIHRLETSPGFRFHIDTRNCEQKQRDRAKEQDTMWIFSTQCPVSWIVTS